MIDLWRWLLGVKSSTGELSGDRWRLELQALPEGGWAVAAIAGALAAAVGIWWLYRKEGRSISLVPRILLAALRSLVVAGVVLMLLELVLVVTHSEMLPAHLLVLVDHSQSMSLGDLYTDEEAGRAVATRLGVLDASGQPDLAALRRKTRMELAQTATTGLLEELSRDRLLAAYGFAGSLDPLEKDPATEISALRPDGGTTGVGDALRGALALHRGHPLAGVLLVTDGRTNSGEDPSKIAAQAAKLGVPIHAVAVGTEEPPRNLKLLELETSPVVFIRDPVQIAALIESQGLQGSTAVVTLESRSADGAWMEAGTDELNLGESGAVQRVEFRFTPDQAGQIEFRARVTGTGPELSDSDNEATTSVRVIRQKIRVLLIASYASPEVQFLRNAMLRDKGLEFASWLQSAGEGYDHIGHRPIRRLPSTQQELNLYDVVILCDPDMRGLGSTWPEMLTRFVGDAGGGLVYIAGEMHSQELFNPGGASSADGAASVDNSWLRILPVVRDAGLYQSAADVRLSSRDTWVLELTNDGAVDQLFRFAPEQARNREILASLPGMYWHFPVTRAKPGASVLAHHGDPRMRNSFGRHVLLATQLYGPGRTVFVGFDSTYRWRYLHEEYFDGFWARVADRVGRSKVLGGRYPFTLATDKTAYRVGDRVTILANLVGTSGEEGTSGITGLRGEVEHSGEAAQPLDFEARSDNSHVLEASFVAEAPGAYTLRVLPSTAADPGNEPRPATMAFRVEPPQQEFDHPTLDRSTLEEVTRTTGGRVFTLAQLRDVPGAFAVRQVERLLEYRHELWNAPLIFGSIFVLLVAEWLLRKKYRLA